MFLTALLMTAWLNISYGTCMLIAAHAFGRESVQNNCPERQYLHVLSKELGQHQGPFHA